jgi:hypothetical protein
MREEQSTNRVLMIRPAVFFANPQTAESNSFQRSDSQADSAALGLARAEFENLAKTLVAAGVCVVQLEALLDPVTPDALFPNNWVSLHPDGKVTLYPMLAPNRRWERRSDVLIELARAGGFRLSGVIDLTHWEKSGAILEGTGSLVLDRLTRTAYASLSARTHRAVLDEFAERMGYTTVAFDSYDRAAQPVYHTNVLLSIGTNVAIVCADAIAKKDRRFLLESLRAQRHVVEISLEQMERFAGNMLELATTDGGLIMVLSTQAHGALSSKQKTQIEAHCGPLVHAPIPTIERLGGGSVRCMLAEIFLQRDALT